jgi:hypothetical protein
MVPSTGNLIYCSAQISILYLCSSGASSSIASALYNMHTFQVAVFITLILFHCIGCILFDPIIPRPHVWVPNIVSFMG